MITIETDHSVTGIQAIAGEVLGHSVSVSQTGRLGQEVSFAADSKGVIPALVAALREGGHEVIVTGMREPIMAKSVRVPDALWDAAKVKADERGEVLSEVIRKALERYVRR